MVGAKKGIDMQINSSFPLRAPALPPSGNELPLRPGRSASESVAAMLARASGRVAEPELASPETLPYHLWVQDASTAEGAAYRWLDGMVNVLKRHDAYSVAIDNYRAVHTGMTRAEAERGFANDLGRAMFDPVPQSVAPSANTNDAAYGRLNAADGHRWGRVMAVLKDSGAYTAAIAHFQIHRVQRLAQACMDWTKFLKSRGMDDASIERFLPERPRLISWEQANSAFMGTLLRAGHPAHLSRHFDEIARSQSRWGQRYA
jgi:hypothetical protein